MLYVDPMSGSCQTPADLALANGYKKTADLLDAAAKTPAAAAPKAAKYTAEVGFCQFLMPRLV